MILLQKIDSLYLQYPLLFHSGGILLLALLINLIMILVRRHYVAKLQRGVDGWWLVTLQAANKPLVILLWYTAALLIAFDFLDYLEQAHFNHTLHKFFSLGVMVICLWIVFRFINYAETALLNYKLGKRRYDRTSIEAVAKISRFFLIAVMILMFMQAAGVPLAAIYTAAGGAGIGISLAAQDLLRNFFGSFVLYFDRPFNIGDTISSPDKNISGIVEKIGWRSTRIRTEATQPLYVANSTFLTISVQNISRMMFRLIKETVSVRYEDFQVIPKITEAIQTMLRNDPDIVTDKNLWVNLINFSASMLDIQIYCYTKVTDWMAFQAMQQKIFLNILAIIQDHGAEAITSSQTVEIPTAIKLIHEDQGHVVTPKN